jgi:uncharacterized protein (TIGR02231 family)
MKILSFRVVVVLITIISSSFAVEKYVESKITNVTVYRDRAQVRRSYTEKLSQGEHNFVFDNLPQSIDPQSVFMDGSGNGILGDVKFRTVTFAGRFDSVAQSLDVLKKRYNDSLAIAEDKIRESSSERQFLENISLKVTNLSSTSETDAPELDNSKWRGMVEFYRKGIEKCNNEIRTTEQWKRAIADSIRLIDEKVVSLGRDLKSDRNQIVATVQMNDAGIMTLNCTYIVSGPTWFPSYELRVLTDKKLLLLTYQGNLHQNTGEDWDNAVLNLSTAQPHIGGSQPELTPWYIDFESSYSSYDRKEKSYRMEKSAPAMNQMYAEEEEKKLEAYEPLVALKTQDAAVSTGGISVVFTIPGKNSVKSDQDEHTMTILTKEFPAVFRYSSVPRLSPHAFLKAKVKNNTEYPLLAGATSIFLDNSFVATGTINAVAPTEEFWTFLGVDEAIKIEHMRINRQKSSDGVLSKRRKIVYDYQIKVTNNRKSEEEIVIWDQLPIPANKDIKVELIEPKFKEGDSSVKKNESQYLEWYFKLKPSQQIVIPFKFNVDHPENRSVYGL